MDTKTQEYLDKILKKSPSELTPDEVAFLKARRSYLKPAQVEEYKEVLEGKSVKKEESVEEETPTEEVENQTSEKSEPVKKSNAKAK